jgi:hypothetical protein
VTTIKEETEEVIEKLAYNLFNSTGFRITQIDIEWLCLGKADYCIQHIYIKTT